MIQVREKNQCCGCEACAQVCPKHCIEMKADIEGFLYPVVNQDSCLSCDLCIKVCPNNKQIQERKPIRVYAARNENLDVISKSSSGGVFSALAVSIINRGGIVWGARFDENWEVLHDCAESIEDLSNFMGSKYVQSRMENCYIEIKRYLIQGRYVLFSGTPCQIAGLRSFLNKEYNNLFLVDVFCHGVPSPLVWRNYLSIAFPNLEDIVKISFRDKLHGWSKYGFSVHFRNSDSLISKGYKSYYAFRDENCFFYGYIRNFYLRPSCYDCKFRSGKSISDLSIGDFWGYNKNDDDLGMNAILVNTPKGEFLLKNSCVNLADATYEELLLGNPVLEKSVQRPRKRDLFWKLYKGNLETTIKKIVKDEQPSKLRVFMSRIKCFMFSSIRE